MLNKLNKYSFKDSVSSEANKPVVVIFHNNCPNCRLVKPHLEDLEKDYDGDVVFYEYETKVEDRITREFYINKTPHICVFIDGLKMFDFTGVVEKQEIKQYIDNLLYSAF